MADIYKHTAPLTIHACYIVRRLCCCTHATRQCAGGCCRRWFVHPYTVTDVRGARCTQGRRCGPLLDQPRLVCIHANLHQERKILLVRRLGDERCAVHKSPSASRARPFVPVGRSTASRPLFTMPRGRFLYAHLWIVLSRIFSLVHKCWRGRRKAKLFLA
jgi:hypothetical protein